MSSDFAKRSNRVVLPAAATSGTPGAETEILGAVPCNERGNGSGAWRVIDLWAEDGVSPFEVTVKWTAGAAGQRTAKITVKGATRLSVCATTIYVSGSALQNADTAVWASVADGMVSSNNEYVVRGTIAVNGSASVAVPSYAKFVRVDLDTESLYATCEVRLVDGWSVTRANIYADAQPNPGLPVGDAMTLTITVTAGTIYRVTFLLNL